MKIGKQFNTCSKSEYFHYIDNYKKYTDFNTLGLYKSIVENEKLSLEEKLEVREYAHQIFHKTFEFLQLKDPFTYIKVSTLELKEMTVGDQNKLWDDIRKNQEKIIKKKRLGHRNFGTYSKHDCGYDTCPLNGIMVHNSMLAEGAMHFHTDKPEYSVKEKAKLHRKNRKDDHKIISEELDHE